jgi:hypothetical protein
LQFQAQALHGMWPVCSLAFCSLLLAISGLITTRHVTGLLFGLLWGPAGCGKEERRGATLLFAGAEVDTESRRWQQHPYHDPMHITSATDKNPARRCRPGPIPHGQALPAAVRIDSRSDSGKNGRLYGHASQPTSLQHWRPAPPASYRIWAQTTVPIHNPKLDQEHIPCNQH